MKIYANFTSTQIIATASMTAALASFSGGLAAATFSSDLQIGGSVALSSIGQSPFSDGNVTQAGTISTTSSGAITTLGYTTAPGIADGSDDGSTTLPATNPLAANLTETGDGIGYSTNLDASFETGFNFNEGYDFITEFGIDLSNMSLTDTFTITFVADYSNVVDAGGPDAFAESKLDLELDNDDVLRSEVLSDTFFGDEKNGVSTGSFGDTISDNDMFMFDVILAPGELALVAGTHQWEGGVYDSGASNVDVLFSLSISNVSCEGACIIPPVPLPAAAYLFASALSGLVLLRRRRQRGGVRS